MPEKKTQVSSVATRYAVCVRNDGYRASLEVRKIYRVIPDRAAAAQGFVRVIDESGEDYCYPTGFFAPITLSKAAREAIAHAG